MGGPGSGRRKKGGESKGDMSKTHKGDKDYSTKSGDRDFHEKGKDVKKEDKPFEDKKKMDMKERMAKVRAARGKGKSKSA